MYAIIIGKLSSGFGLLLGKAKNLDTKQAIIFSIPFGAVGGFIASLFF